MKKKNVEGLEHMMSGYLHNQYRYYLHLKSIEGIEQEHVDFQYERYAAICLFIEGIGGEWRRHYIGKGYSREQLDDIANYKHSVFLPSDSRCERLNFNAWDE